jgi:hypothetical protein
MDKKEFDVMTHDEYYPDMPDLETLAEELDKYINWVEVCSNEDCPRDTELDLQAQIYAAKAVRANIKRIYEV